MIVHLSMQVVGRVFFFLGKTITANIKCKGLFLFLFFNNKHFYHGLSV